MPQTQIRIPKLGMDTAEALLGKWLVQVGDPIQKGTPLVELESEKVVFEHQSEVDGRLVEILVPEGQMVPVGEVIALAETD